MKGEYRLYHPDTGHHLMWLESEVCRAILEWATENREIVLPIHDSFIVPARRRDDLEIAMLELYEREFGSVSSSCRLTTSYVGKETRLKASGRGASERSDTLR